MLEIFPIQTKEEQISACNAVGAHFLEDTRAYVAALNDKVIAICQFRLTDEGGEIHALDSLSSADIRTLVILARGALSFIGFCGHDRALFLADAANRELISAIGFTETEDGKFTLNLK